MNCSNCGAQVKENEKFCQNCGISLKSEKMLIEAMPIAQTNNNMVNNYPYNYNFNNNANNNMDTNNYQVNGNNSKLWIIVGMMFVIVVILVSLLIMSPKRDVSITSNSSGNLEEKSKDVAMSGGKTSIDAEKTFSNNNINNLNDALNLIVKDSKEEKAKCSNKDINTIEDRVVNNYGILTVNLCELDIDFAKEIENVVKTIYTEFPMARDYLTNLTLINPDSQSGYIAAFAPTLLVAPTTYDSYPYVFKTAIIMNSKYFLNINKLESSMKQASNSGHFPKNTTRTSSVAHEFGHYLSFLTLLTKANLERTTYITSSNIQQLYNAIDDFKEGASSLGMIEEAYQNYKVKYNTSITLLEFRGSISQYALAKDKNGNYIYDETIAEAFHDYYLNRNNAEKASLEIVAVLKAHLQKRG